MLILKNMQVKAFQVIYVEKLTPRNCMRDTSS